MINKGVIRSWCCYWVFIWCFIILTLLKSNEGAHERNALNIRFKNSHTYPIPKSVGSFTTRESLSLLAFIAPFIVMGTHTVRADESRLSMEFYERWPYTGPSDFVNYIFSTTEEGDFDGVVKAMDKFAEVYPMYKLSPAKALFLSNVVTDFKPQKIVEIGSFFGYSALIIARTMTPTSSLTCIEGSKANVEVAKKVLVQAFGRNNPVLDRIRIVEGLSSTVLQSPDVPSVLFRGLSIRGSSFKFAVSTADEPATIDLLFLDHDKDCYLPDLRAIESKQLLHPNRAVVVADNVIFPGAPDFLRYVNYSEKRGQGVGGTEDVNTDTKGDTMAEAEQASVPTTKRWITIVERLPFERVGFETQFKQVEDGMSLSTYGIFAQPPTHSNS